MPEYKDVDKNDMPKYLSVIEEMVLAVKHHQTVDKVLGFLPGIFLY